LLSPQG